MFDGIISGRLVRKPKGGETRTGKPLANCLLKVTCEHSESTLLVSVIAFEDRADSLMRLDSGDAVTVSGPCRMTEWERDGETRHGVAVTAHQIMTAYKERKKRPEAKKQKSWDVYDDAEPFDDEV